MFDRPHLGRLLVSRGIVSEPQLEAALELQGEQGCRLGEALVRMGLCTEVDIARALSEQIQLPFIDLEQTPPSAHLLRTIPRELAQRLQVVPVRMEGDRLVVVARNPLDLQVDEVLRKATGRPVLVAAGSESQIRQVLATWEERKWARGMPQNPRSAAVSASVQHGPTPLVAASEQAQTVQLLDSLIAQAVRRGATEMSFEPDGGGLQVRGRIDGHLHALGAIPLARAPGVIARLKIISGIPIGDEGGPTSGFCDVRVDGRAVRLMVEVLRTAGGEILVVSTPSQRVEMLPLDELGLTPAALAPLRRALVERSGIVLVAGPRESGRGTTLRALLAEVAGEHLRVVTVESAAGVRLPGVTHLVAADATPAAMATTLHQALAQNPDVLYVSEVPDKHVADLICRAAVEGRLVLCGSRAPTALGAVARLMDLGPAAPTLAAALRVVVGQRLLRRVCPACAVEHPLSFELDRALRTTFGHVPAGSFRRGRGCVACHHHGTTGRVGAFEVLDVDDDLRRLLAERVMPRVLTEYVQSVGFVSLEEDAFEKAVDGIVSPDEILHLRAGVAHRVAETTARPRAPRRSDMELLAPLAAAPAPFAALAEEPDPESWEEVAGLAESLAL